MQWESAFSDVGAGVAMHSSQITLGRTCLTYSCSFLHVFYYQLPITVFLQFHVIKGAVLDRDCSNLLSFLLTENDVDGMTMLKLTEAMVGQLLPTMKMQVKFIEEQQILQSASPSIDTSADSAAAAAVVADIQPSVIAQNGYVKKYIQHYCCRMA